MQILSLFAVPSSFILQFRKSHNSSFFFFLFPSNAVWKGEILLLSLPDQRSAVDLVADPLLHHIPSVELQTGVHCLYSHRCQVSLARVPWGMLLVSLQKLKSKSFFFLFFSYAEVRAEKRRAFGFEELSPPEIAPSSVKVRPLLIFSSFFFPGFKSDPNIKC